MTVRRLLCLLKHLPHDSALARALSKQQPWQVGDYLLADVYGALTGHPHPARPKALPSVPDPALDRKRRAALARARERQRLIDAGEIT